MPVSRKTVNRQTLIKFLKFGLIGCSGMIVDFSFTWILKEELGANKYLANSTGVVAAATSNYILNRIWTFQSRHKKVFREYIIFLAIALTGLAFNNAIIWLLSDKIFGMNFYAAKAIAIGTVFIWNFGMNHFFNFKGEEVVGG
jgi:putative flippase GtrA